MDKIVTRSFQTERTIDEENRTVEITFSSEEPYRRYFLPFNGIEILGHEDDEVDLTRLNNSGIVLRNHGGETIGVVERAWIESGKGKAIIKISANEEALWRDIKDGILRNISVGYSIEQFERTATEDDEPNEYRVVKWHPTEVAIKEGCHFKTSESKKHTLAQLIDR